MFRVAKFSHRVSSQWVSSFKICGGQINVSHDGLKTHFFFFLGRQEDSKYSYVDTCVFLSSLRNMQRTWYFVSQNPQKFELRKPYFIMLIHINGLRNVPRCHPYSCNFNRVTQFVLNSCNNMQPNNSLLQKKGITKFYTWIRISLTLLMHRLRLFWP